MANKAKFGQAGWIARPNRRLYIVNGSKLVTAEKQQAFLPADGEITSGQAVERVWKGDEEVFQVATAASKSVYFANADSKDWDVQACGKLPAIYSGDDFEIQTPFFDQTVVYNPGDKLYVSAGGVVTKTANSGPVVGIVSKGVINLGSYAQQPENTNYYVEAQPAAVSLNATGYTYKNAHTGVNGSIEEGLITGGPRVWTNDTESQYVLQFYTKCIPAAS